MSSHLFLKKEGYLIKKDQIDPATTQRIKKDLTVAPIVLSAYKEFVKPNEFEIFRESPNYFFLPRFYGIQTFGKPKKNQLPLGQPINCRFGYNLLPHQIKAYDHTLQSLREVGGGILQIPCGMGKCLGRGTPILMFDGTIKKVEDVVVGDQLMGDDSQPRTVLSLARGREEMYEIRPSEGPSWTCNRSHILSLRSVDDGSLHEMELSEYLRLRDSLPLRLYRVPVIFAPRRIKMNPYFLGFWLGRLQQNGFNQGIPKEYKCNSREVQLQVLASLIDSIGHLQGHGYEITQPNEKLVDDVVFISRSLGYTTVQKKCGTLFSCQIEGAGLHEIPCQKIVLPPPSPLPSPSSSPPSPLSPPSLFSEFSVQSIGEGDYYGFTLDGNGRFLLGDLTVTHNTCISLKIACDLGVKTLVVVNKECLMDQWHESILKFTGKETKIGVLQQSKIDVEGKDFVIAMLHSLCKKDYPQEILSDIGFCIADEVHHLSSEMFSKALPKMTSRYMLGLSATPFRKDGLSHVFHKYMGEICHAEKRAGKNQVLIKRLKLTSQSPLYETVYMSNGIKNTVAMITNLSKCEIRTDLIVETIRCLMKQDRKILLLSGRREHLEEIYQKLEQSTIQTVQNRKITFGYYRGGQGESKKAHRLLLQESAKCDVVLGTYSIACLSDQTVYVNYLTGEEMTLETMSQRPDPLDVPVISLDEEYQDFEVDHAIKMGYTASKQCYRIVHDLGQMVASFDHQFYTQRGWVPLEQLTVDDQLLSDRKLNMYPRDIPSLTGDECWLLGHLLAKHTLPRSLMMLPQKKIISLLDGLYAEEEVIDQQICYHTRSYRMKNQVVFLLKRLGIQPIISLPQPPDMIYGVTISLTSSIAGEHCFVKIHQIEKLEHSENIRLCDLTVQKNHNFLINGILVHNSEGLDIPDLNTEIMATPVCEIEQSVGRILRKCHDRVNPLVVDLVDTCGNFVKQAGLRSKFYQSEDYIIQNMKIPLGQDPRDLKPFIPELQEYLTSDETLKQKTSVQDLDETSDDENHKKMPFKMGRCLLTDQDEYAPLPSPSLKPCQTKKKSDVVQNVDMLIAPLSPPSTKKNTGKKNLGRCLL